MRKRTVKILGIFGIPTLILVIFRLIAIVFHNTQLERLYKPRQWRRTPHHVLSQEVLDKLPKYCQSLSGMQMDPINLIFIGEEKAIKKAFKKAGWHTAHPATPVHLLLGFFSAVLNKSYHRGPFTPLFLSIGLQDMALQKPTAWNSFRQRHHVRIWRSQVVLPKGQRVWVAAASFDTDLKFTTGFPFIHHQIDENLDAERDFIIKDIEKVGGLLLERVEFCEAIPKNDLKKNAYGEKFYTDGYVAVMEVPNAA